MSLILHFLRTSPAPKVNPARPLLPGAPSSNSLPLNPELYFTLAIDSVAPLVKVRNMKGLGGGGTALEIPEPLAARTRRRMAFMWILDTVDKKKSRGSGRKQFPARVAEEIIAARANLNHPRILKLRL
jgi:small subunit ribosomal protein S7